MGTPGVFTKEHGQVPGPDVNPAVAKAYMECKDRLCKLEGTANRIAEHFADIRQDLNEKDRLIFNEAFKDLKEALKPIEKLFEERSFANPQTRGANRRVLETLDWVNTAMDGIAKNIVCLENEVDKVTVALIEQISHHKGSPNEFAAQPAANPGWANDNVSKMQEASSYKELFGQTGESIPVSSSPTTYPWESRGSLQNAPVPETLRTSPEAYISSGSTRLHHSSTVVPTSTPNVEFPLIPKPQLTVEPFKNKLPSSLKDVMELTKEAQSRGTAQTPAPSVSSHLPQSSTTTTQVSQPLPQQPQPSAQQPTAPKGTGGGEGGFFQDVNWVKVIAITGLVCIVVGGTVYVIDRYYPDFFPSCKRKFLRAFGFEKDPALSVEQKLKDNEEQMREQLQRQAKANLEKRSGKKLDSPLEEGDGTIVTSNLEDISNSCCNSVTPGGGATSEIATNQAPLDDQWIVDQALDCLVDNPAVTKAVWSVPLVLLRERSLWWHRLRFWWWGRPPLFFNQKGNFFWKISFVKRCCPFTLRKFRNVKIHL
jgi:hypothetical protein